ncbi:MAG: ABC transporter ATP-binding protein, partial [Oscillospiraceae bacterium]|nr:ABC transporter ATP-binding protein [Oscillospiraceae bacterium]
MPPRGGRHGKLEKPKSAKGTLLRMIQYLMNFRWVILVLLICTFVSNVGNLLGPRFASEAIGAVDAGPGQVDMNTVYHYAGLMLAAYLTSNVLSFLVNQGMMRVSRRMAQKMRRDVFHKLMVLPVSYFDRHQAGDIISRVSYDIDVVSTCLATDVVQILTSLVTVVGSFIMMCTISLPLVSCMVVTLPLAILYTNYMGKKTRPRYSKRSASYGRMNGYVEEMFSGQKTILAYAYENDVCEDFSAINHAAADAYRDADSLGMTMGPTIGMINNLGMA